MTAVADAGPATRQLEVWPETAYFVRWCRTYLCWIQGPTAGQPVDFAEHPWVIENVLNPIFEPDRGGDDSRRQHSAVWMGLAKGNLKSSIAAALALYWIVVVAGRPGRYGLQAFCIAASKEQARTVHGYAKRMVDESPLLGDWLTVTKDSVLCRANQSYFQVMASDGPKLHSRRPDLVIVDELHAHETGEAFTAMTTSMMSTSSDPLAFICTNAGPNEQGDSVWAQEFRRFAKGKDLRAHMYNPRVPDDRLDDQTAWKLANPAKFITIERLVETSKRFPPFMFYRWFLNVPTRAAKSWLRPGAWAACADPQDALVPGELVVVGVDMSRRHDSTAVVVVAPRPDGFHCWAETWGTWPDPGQPPPAVHHVIEGDEIPFHAVWDRVKELCAEFSVQEVVFDPYRVPDESSERLEMDGLPMVRFDQSHTRMIPAAQGLFSAVIGRELKHTGDELFTRQIEAAVVKEVGRRGWVFDKTPDRAFMDATIALAIALDRAREYRGLDAEDAFAPRFI